MVNCAQLNAGKRGDSLIEMSIRVADGKTDIIFIQEPWNLKKTNVKGGRFLVSNKKLDKPHRAAIWVSDIFATASKCIVLENLSDRDCTTIKAEISIDGKPKTVLLSSIYMPTYEEKIITAANGNTTTKNSYISNPITSLIDDIGDYAKANDLEIIISCDSNSHSDLWGGDFEDSRGSKVIDYILKNNLVVMNVGDTPTFVEGNKSSFIDLTIVSQNFLNYIIEWRVDNINNSFSDHRYIYFKINSRPFICESHFSKRKTNWKSYTKRVRERILNLSVQVNSRLELDLLAKNFNHVLRESFEESCVKKKLTSNFQTNWYSDKLNNLRKNCNRSYNKMHRAIIRDSPDAETRKNEYKDKKKIYKIECRKSKRNYWRKNMENLDNMRDIARVQKFFETGKQSKLGAIMKADGTYTESYSETAEELMKIHFPNCQPTEVDLEDTDDLNVANISDEEINEINDIVTDKMISWSINSFGAYKSGGGDLIFPAMLQKAGDVILPILRELFRASLKFKYIPKIWRDTSVCFIPKPGKTSYDRAKSFRPISLMSFVLKTLEKILDHKIKTGPLIKNPIEKTQYAYASGRSTETALHNLVAEIEKGLQNDGFAVTIFIDIEAAFDGCTFETLEKAAQNKEVPQFIIDWYKAMLNHRNLKADILGSDQYFRPVQGIPQGGIASPIFWNMVIDPLIKRLSDKVDIHNLNIMRVQAHTSGFADDLAITVAGKIKNKNTVLGNANKAMKIVETWCQEVGLSVNPDKTFAIRFTKGKVKWQLDNVKIFGKNIEWVDSIKYLGVTIDKNLSWRPHINNALSRAKRSLFASKSMLGKSWGLTPKNMMWVFNQIILPRITYGAIVWWRVTEVNKYRDQLISIQRLACLMISGATKTTPTYALLNLLGLIPIDIKIRIIALKTCIRLKATDYWKCNQIDKSHTKIEDLIEWLTEGQECDNMTPVWNTDNKFGIVINEKYKWNAGLHIKGNMNCWYVDGSKKHEKVSAGMYNQALGTRKSFRLTDNTSNTQAEMMAIKLCSEFIQHRPVASGEILILTDCLSALKNLQAMMINTKTTQQCRNSLNQLGNDNNLTIAWVPGHSNIVGNVEADKTAKEGLSHRSVEVNVPINLNELNKAINNKEITLANRKWNEVKIRLKALEGYILDYDIKRTRELLRLHRSDLRVIIGLSTGHGCCNKFLFKINRADNPWCRFCSYNKEETVRHWLEECRGLDIYRLMYLGHRHVNQNNFQTISISKLLKFAKISGIYETFNFWNIG